jgi:hypothetical protein
VTRDILKRWESAEKRLQLEMYSRALARHLEGVLYMDSPDDGFVFQLRPELPLPEG